MRQHSGRETPLPSPINTIIEAVASEWGLTKDELLSASRNPRYAHPRIISMQLCRELTNASFPTIARKHNRKDHSTVLSAMKRAPELLDKFPDYRIKRAAVLAHLGL